MAGQPLRTPPGEHAEQPWRSSLDALEATLAKAARAITELRFSLEEENAANSGPVAVPDDPAANEKSERLTDFERVWQRLERKRKEPSASQFEQDDLSKPSGTSEPSVPHAARFKQDDLSNPSELSEQSEPSAARYEQDELSNPSDLSERSEPSAARFEQDDLSNPSDLSEPSVPHAARFEQDDLSNPSDLSEQSEPSAARSEQDDLSMPSGVSEPSKPRGLDLLPSNYLMTIEDRDASVDLITLQRGLLTLAPMEDIRLVTYAKGVPVISLRFEGELDLERLSEAIGSATGRRCEVIPQDGFKLFLRLTPDDDQQEDAT